MAGCENSLATYDIAATAGFYSQLAGVLAGFAFGSLTLVVQGSHRRKKFEDENAGLDRDRQLLLALAVAFLLLIIATLLYSVIGGEKGCALVQGRTDSEQFLSGITFALAIFTLLWAIVHLVGNAGIHRGGVHIRFIVATMGPPLAVMFLTLAAQDIALTPWKVNPGTNEFEAQQGYWSDVYGNSALVVPALAFLTGLAAWLVGFRTRNKIPGERSRSQRIIQAAGTLFPYLSIIIAIAATVRSSLLSVAPPSTKIDNNELITWMAACSAVLLAQGIVLCFQPGSDAAVLPIPNDPGEEIAPQAEG
jgi:hypothetical protein